MRYAAAGAFLTFMSISAFPAFVEDMKVFTRERLNGYYGVATFVVANTLSSLPFIALIALASSCAVYFISNLNYHGFGRFVFFVLDLFLSLVVVESLMTAIAPLVPHFLAGIAAGAGILGFFMLVCGFFQPRGQLPKPIFFYPAHFLSFETYSFVGFMRNEFQDTDGWGCPCSRQPGGCPPQLGGAACRMDGAAVLDYWVRRPFCLSLPVCADLRSPVPVSSAVHPVVGQVVDAAGAGGVGRLLPRPLLPLLQAQGVARARTPLTAAKKTRCESQEGR
jgi:hypothetical protein